MTSNTHVAAFDSYMTGVSFLNIVKFMERNNFKFEETKHEEEESKSVKENN
jgi:hypothetical protein